MKFSEEILRENLCDTRLDEYFLGTATKAHPIEENLIWWTLGKIKAFAFQKSLLGE